MKTHTRIRHYATIDGVDLTVELPIPMSSIMDHKAPLVRIADDLIALGYLADDSDCANPLEEDDYAGSVYTAHRNGTTLRKYEEARGLGPYEGQAPNRHAVLLDVYVHGGVAYSLSGEGMQCQFDTAKNAAIWVPGECQRTELDALARKADEVAVRARRREMAKADAEQYTAWCNGDFYLTVMVTYDKDGQQIDWDTCGGYVGGDSAYEILVSEFPKEVAHD